MGMGTHCPNGHEYVNGSHRVIWLSRRMTTRECLICKKAKRQREIANGKRCPRGHWIDRYGACNAIKRGRNCPYGQAVKLSDGTYLVDNLDNRKQVKVY